MSNENKSGVLSSFARLLQPRSMLSRLFLFLAVSVVLTNLLLVFISYSRYQENNNYSAAYQLGFQLESVITAFLYRPTTALKQSPRLSWKKFDVGSKPLQFAFAEAGLTGWIGQPLFLPPSTAYQPTHLIKLTLQSLQPLYLNSSAYSQGNYHGDITLPEVLANLSEKFARSGKDVKLVLHNTNGKMLVISSPAYWHSKSALAQYDFLLYVALVLFFMGLPFAAGLVLAPVDELLDELKTKGRGSTQITAGGCTEVSEITSEFNHQLAELKQHNDDRISFVAAISHDLGVPATRLRLRASLIKDEDIRERLIQDTNEMSAMIEDSLLYLRNESVDEQSRVVDFLSLVQSLHQDFLDMDKQVFFSDQPSSGLNSSAQMTFQTVPSVFSGTPKKIDFRQHGPVTLNCKPRAMRRAISNLIDNALKFGKAALIELEADHSSVVVKIIDKGPGVPDQELDNILQPFYRLEKSRRRSTGGTGLGLAIVNRIVKDHDGFLALENIPEGGFQVAIALPRDVPKHFEGSAQ